MVVPVRVLTIGGLDPCGGAGLGADARAAARLRATPANADDRPLLERLAALIPRPRVHLTTYRGNFAPAAAYRDRVVPAPDEQPDAASPCAHSQPTPAPPPIAAPGRPCRPRPAAGDRTRPA
jgi:hypothetical protein